MLSALQVVDAVTIFDEDTPEELIGALLPDILVKGADWNIEQIAGAPDGPRQWRRSLDPAIAGRAFNKRHHRKNHAALLLINDLQWNG